MHDTGFMRRLVPGLAAAAVLAAAALVVGYVRGPRGDARVVARVGRAHLTVADVKAAMLRRSGGRPDVFESPGARRELLEELVDRVALAEAARRGLWASDPDLRWRVWGLLADRARQAELQEHAGDEMTEQELADAYAARTNLYAVPARSRYAMIRMDLPHGASEEYRAGLEARMRQAHGEAAALPPADTHFGALAVTYSTDQASRYRGGDIGWMNADDVRGRFGDEWARHLLGLTEPGALTPVLSSDRYLAIFRLTGLEPARRLPLAEVRRDLAARLRRERDDARLALRVREARRELGLRVNRRLLDSIVPPPGTADRAAPPALPE